jgi:4-hydroxybenzoate polyprenyltransferase
VIAWLAKALRPTTRVWFDVLAPLALVSMMGVDLVDVRVLAAVAGILLWHAGQTFFNDLVDVATDRASKDPSRHLRALASGLVTSRRYLVAGIVTTVAAAGVSIWLGPWCAVVMLGVLIPAGLGYNFKGLSGHPQLLPFGWPLVWSAIYAFCAAAVDFRGWTQGLPYLGFVIVFMGMGEGLTQDIRDAENDRAGGRRTTVVHYGVPLTSKVALGCFTASLAPWFLAGSKGPLWALVAGTSIVVTWLVLALRATRRLQTGFHYPDARLLHVGAIVAFTGMNLLAIAT